MLKRLDGIYSWLQSKGVENMRLKERVTNTAT